MKKTFAPLALAALLFATPALHADEESARAKLAEDNVAFTPEAFLHEAASGNAEHIKLFLEGGMDPATKRADSNETAFWQAVEFKSLDVVKALIAAGVLPNETNAPVGAYGKTIVFAAVDTGDAAFVRALVEAGADAKKGNDFEVPPLGEAARNGNLEMCEILIKAGADPNATSAGFPILFGPIIENHLDAVRLLLKSGAKLGEQKAELIEAATSPEMRELLEKAE
jgi:ankyrin repeat protein